ncbi:hypothetical protein [Streptomyces sp. NBC_01474]|uniref:hypothetical protein n=1 Tax=Streptomyces sp. NBC_01474 TaxID=2903880 RepID=UPI003FA34A70
MAWYGINAVVGIGPSWTVAAMASSRTGPGGVKYVSAAETDAFLGHLSVGDLYGIRRHQTERLRRFGVASVGQLAACPQPPCSVYWAAHPGEQTETAHPRLDSVEDRPDGLDDQAGRVTELPVQVAHGALPLPKTAH